MRKIMSSRVPCLGSLLYTVFRICKTSTRVPNDQKTREGISARNRPTDDLDSEMIKRKLKNNCNQYVQ